MPLVGAHMSIAGGYYKAVDAAGLFGMGTVQIFTKNNNQWAGKPISAEDVRLFRDALERTGVRSPVAHDSYLINLASPNEALWERSIAAFIHELERADLFGIFGVVMHPGSYVETSIEAGISRVVAGLNRVHRASIQWKPMTLLEVTAGQGTNLGYRFEEIAAIREGLEDPSRTGVCLDTCHLFAAGYEIHTEAGYESTMQELDRLVGISHVRAIHLNDSVKGLGSRVDRHAKIGGGQIGLGAFQRILNDPRFQDVPMYLETPKGEEEGRALDAINMETLLSLMEIPKKPSKRKASVPDMQRNPQKVPKKKSTR